MDAITKRQVRKKNGPRLCNTAIFTKSVTINKSNYVILQLKLCGLIILHLQNSRSQRV